MTTLPNPIRDILGEVAPPPHVSQTEYDQQLAVFTGDVSKLNAMEVFLLQEIFYQFKNIEYLQLKRRHIFYEHMSQYVHECYEDDQNRPKNFDEVLNAIEDGQSPSENKTLAKFFSQDGWDWRETQAAIFDRREYYIPDFEREIDKCHDHIGKLQKMLNAASLTPAMKRRLEAQSQLIEQDLTDAKRTIEHEDPKGEGDEQPRQAKLKSA